MSDDNLSRGSIIIHHHVGRHFSGTVAPVYFTGNAVYNWEGGKVPLATFDNGSFWTLTLGITHDFR